MYNMAYSLAAAGANVKILAFNTKKHYTEPSSLPGTFKSLFQPEFEYLDASIRLWPAFSNLFSGESYNISRFDSPGFHKKLSEVLAVNSYDVVQLESVFMASYIDTIKKYSDARIVLRAHNVENIIWKRLSRATRNPVKSWYLGFLSKRLKEFEKGILNKLDAITVLTREDKTTFRNMGFKGPVYVVPVGIDTGVYNMEPSANVPMVAAHLGSMDWMPNIEGVNWFLGNVLPMLRNSGTKVPVVLAGKAMPENIFKQSNELLEVFDRIDDIRSFYRDKQIMIVPLLSGGGMRVKIIEGMAMGRTIVSTAIGAEGIEAEPGRNMIIADNPSEFSEAILDLARNPEKAYGIGKAARETALRKYDNVVLGKTLTEHYRGLVAANYRMSQPEQETGS